MRLAASITSVPAGTATFCSLIVKLTCFCSGISSSNFVRLSHHQQILRAPVSALALQMIFEFIPPLLHDADRRHRRRITKRTESFSQQVLSKFADQRNIFAASAAIMEAIEHFAQPSRAF